MHVLSKYSFVSFPQFFSIITALLLASGCGGEGANQLETHAAVDIREAAALTGETIHVAPDFEKLAAAVAFESEELVSAVPEADPFEGSMAPRTEVPSIRDSVVDTSVEIADVESADRTHSPQPLVSIEDSSAYERARPMSTASHLLEPPLTAETVAASSLDVLTGFDSGEVLIPSADGQRAELVGSYSQRAVLGRPASAYDMNPGSLAVQYEGGNYTQRHAEIARERSGNANRVLNFYLSEANVRDASGKATKGRVQLNAYQSAEVRAREVRFSTRMYLRPGFDTLRDMSGTFSWLTISEWLNNAGFAGQPYPFRIYVSIVKPSKAGGSPLRFSVHAQARDEGTKSWNKTIWKSTNEAAEVPTGKWVTLEYWFREGNRSQGRFVLTATPDDGKRQVIFDVRGWTHHPDDPHPDGLTHLNPVKLYTSKAILDYLGAKGKSLEVSWDNLAFRLCRDRSAESSSPCAIPVP